MGNDVAWSQELVIVSVACGFVFPVYADRPHTSIWTWTLLFNLGGFMFNALLLRESGIREGALPREWMVNFVPIMVLTVVGGLLAAIVGVMTVREALG